MSAISRRSRPSKANTCSGNSPLPSPPLLPALTTDQRLAYQSIGVIYGDIGTSPLYVYSSTFSSNPSYDDLLGALSLIIWSLTLMVSVKYVLIVLRADDEGEGGTFAVFSLLSRYANIVNRDPREEQTVKMERVKTSDLGKSSKYARSFMERSRLMKMALELVGVLGVSLVMSGMFSGDFFCVFKGVWLIKTRWCSDARSVRAGCDSRVRNSVL